MFNEHQRAHMAYLASLPASAKCACGWSERGKCFGPCYGHPERGGYPQCACPVCKQTVPLWQHDGTPRVGRHDTGYHPGCASAECRGSLSPLARA